MKKEDIIKHNEDVQSFIKRMKSTIISVDSRKIQRVKKLCRKTTEKIEVPFDIITYESVMMTRIKTRQRELEIPHKELPIKKEPIEVPINDVMGWLELMLRNIKKHLNRSFFIDYRKYKRYMKKDKQNIVKENFYKIYELQKELVTSEIEYIVELYKLLPSIINLAKKKEG